MRMLAVIALATAIASPAMAQAPQARYKQDPQHCDANNAVDPYCRASQWRGSRYSGPRGDYALGHPWGSRRNLPPDAFARIQQSQVTIFVPNRCPDGDELS